MAAPSPGSASTSPCCSRRGRSALCSRSLEPARGRGQRAPSQRARSWMAGHLSAGASRTSPSARYGPIAGVGGSWPPPHMRSAAASIEKGKGAARGAEQHLQNSTADAQTQWWTARPRELCSPHAYMRYKLQRQSETEGYQERKNDCKHGRNNERPKPQRSTPQIEQTKKQESATEGETDRVERRRRHLLTVVGVVP